MDDGPTPAGDGDDRRRRRRFLRAVGAVAVGGIVGCGGDGAGTGTDNGTPARGTTSTVEPTPNTRSPTGTAGATAAPTTAASAGGDDGRPAGYRTPDPPAFDDPDGTRDGVEVFRGVPFEETPEATLALDFHRPVSDESLPLVVHVHGGAWRFGERTGYAPWHPGEGVAAATVQYRLSGTATYPAAVRDVAAAVTWLRRDAADAAGIDPDSVVVRGKSAGAHLAALVATAPETDAFAPVGVDPELDGLAGLLGVSGVYDLTAPGVSEARYVRQFLGCDVDDCPGTYEEASPVRHASEGDPPTVLWHGEADDIVAVEQSIRFRDALAAAGVSVDLSTPAEAGHVEERTDPYREAFRERERQFLDGTVGLSD